MKEPTKLERVKALRDDWRSKAGVCQGAMKLLDQLDDILQSPDPVPDLPREELRDRVKKVVGAIREEHTFGETDEFSDGYEMSDDVATSYIIDLIDELTNRALAASPSSLLVSSPGPAPEELRERLARELARWEYLHTPNDFLQVESYYRANVERLNSQAITLLALVAELRQRLKEEEERVS